MGSSLSNFKCFIFNIYISLWAHDLNLAARSQQELRMRGLTAETHSTEE